MPTFTYEAIADDGQTRTGSISAETPADVVARLGRDGLTPTTITPEDEPDAAQQARADTPKKKKESAGSRAPAAARRAKVKLADLCVFTRQLATMVDAGLPIDQAFETLADQTSDEGFQAVLYDILAEIRRGSRMSDAIAKYRKIFPTIYISMVRAAEASGQLATILNQLAGYMESAQRVKQKVKSAMTYPVLATGMIITVAAVLILVVVPQFEAIFDLVDGDLPLPTRIVLGISDFATNNILATLLIIVATVVSFIVILKTEKGRYGFDLMKLKMPVFGTLFSQVAIAKFSRTLSTLLSSGVPILDALAIVEEASGNAVIGSAVKRSISRVSGGSGLAEVFETRSVFPPMLVKMIAVGEQTGELDSLLDKVADFYDERVTSAIEGLTSMIEPLLIGMLGLVVGGIVVSIFFPMIKLTQSIGG